ncbi:MAG: hypothetical protein WAL59_00650 [Roseiarcus sp.]
MGIGENVLVSVASDAVKMRMESSLRNETGLTVIQFREIALLNKICDEDVALFRGWESPADGGLAPAAAEYGGSTKKW